MEKKLLVMSGLLSMTVIGVLAGIEQGIQPLPTQEAAVAPVSFTPVAQGEASSVPMRVNYIVTSPDEFAMLWQALGATSTPPTVDFSAQSVLAVFAGAVPEARIVIDKIQDLKTVGERLVSITITRPQETCAMKEASTSPYEVVVVPATSLQVTHEDSVTVTTCPN
jgi:hypothetical protein